MFCTAYFEKVSHMNLVVAMFLFCNTHYVVTPPMPFSGGAEFECAAPAVVRWRCLVPYYPPTLNGPIHPNLSPTSDSPLSARWMNEWHVPSGCGGLAWCSLGRWWWWLMVDDGGDGTTEEPSSQEQEKIPECWGWWRGSPDLSQGRHAKSQMYRIYPFSLSVN